MPTPKPASTTKTCAHQGCSCRNDQFGGVDKGENWFCSEGCAQGSGCDHASCHCSSVRNHDPDNARRGEPKVPGAMTKPAPKRNPGHHATHNPGQGAPATRRNP